MSTEVKLEFFPFTKDIQPDFDKEVIVLFDTMVEGAHGRYTKMFYGHKKAIEQHRVIISLSGTPVGYAPTRLEIDFEEDRGCYRWAYTTNIRELLNDTVI